jgi:hypothetical protein
MIDGISSDVRAFAPVSCASNERCAAAASKSCWDASHSPNGISFVTRSSVRSDLSAAAMLCHSRDPASRPSVHSTKVTRIVTISKAFGAAQRR